MIEFLNMGGHAIYIWPSYGLSVGLLIYYHFSIISKKKRLLRELTAIRQTQNLKTEDCPHQS